MPTTPNLGLTIPVGGTTPGAANNTTPGSYPFVWLGNLNIIDAQCLSIPNNPAGIVNGGIKQPLDGNVNFGGFGITNASTAAFSSTISVGGISTLTGGVASPLLVGAGLLNTITLTGKATGTDPTITVAGDATRNLVINYPTASGAVIAGLGLLPTSGGPALLGSLGSGTYAALWLGTALGSETSSNYTIASNGGGATANTTIIAGSSGALSLVVGAAVELAVSSSSIGIGNIPIQQSAASTGLTLRGNAALTGSLGAVILDNVGLQTSGVMTSFRTGGNQVAAVSYAGGFTSNNGNFLSGTVGQGIVLNPQAAAAGNALVIANAGVDVGGTGQIAVFQSIAGTSQFAISGRGHLIPLSTAPTAVLNALYGSTATSPCTGGDASFRIAILSQGAGIGAIAAGTLIATVTLAQPYSSANFTALASFASNVAVGEISPLQCVAVGATIQIYNYAGFTPVTGHNYVIDVITMGAGATS